MESEKKDTVQASHATQVCRGWLQQLFIPPLLGGRSNRCSMKPILIQTYQNIFHLFPFNYNIPNLKSC